MTDNEILDKYYKEAENSFNSSNYDEAIELSTKIIELNDCYKKAYFIRGRSFYRKGNYNEAIIDFNKTIELDDEYINGYNNRGLCYLNLERYEEAIKDFNKTIKLDDKYTHGYNNRGLCYLNLKRYEEAIKDFNKTIELDDKYTHGYNNRGLCYKNLKRYEEAIEDFNKRIELDDKSVYGYNNRGYVYTLLGKYKKAVSDLTKAINIDSEYIKAYRNRKRAYDKLGDSEACKKDDLMIRFLKIKEKDEKFFRYIKKHEEDPEKRAQIGDLFSTVIKLKESLIYKQKDSVGHYTKIENLKFLFKSHKEALKELPRLRLNNVTYMNDPTEGEVFIKLLKDNNEEKITEILDNLYGNKNELGREVYNGKNNVFLLSFSKAIDTSLPMWVQYTDNGDGCCVVLDSSFFDEKEECPLGNAIEIQYDTEEAGSDSQSIVDTEEKEYYCLYSIRYLDQDDGYKLPEGDESIELIQNIGKQLSVFEEDIKKDKTIIKGILHNLLDQVRFLFKDKNYEHEKEVRLVKFEDNGKVKYTGDAEGFRVPHVYIDLEKELKAKEVILGPRVSNGIEIANYLYFTGNVDKVSRSQIKYQ